MTEELRVLRLEIAEMVFKARKEKGISQVHLAKLVGLKPQSIARLETGKITLSINKMWDIAWALGKKLRYELVIPAKARIQKP